MSDEIDTSPAVASGWIRKWCKRHDGAHTQSLKVARWAASLPLVHAVDLKSLRFVVDNHSLACRGKRPLYFFVGPSRRTPPRGAVAAIFIFEAGFEVASPHESCSSLPYDSGGARKYAKMSPHQSARAASELAMDGAGFRGYLRSLLSCAFESPVEYLRESPGPDLDTEGIEQNAAANGLKKAMKQRANSSCWTVEVSLTPPEGILNLTSCKHLLLAVVFGEENEPIASVLEKVLGPERTRWVSEPHVDLKSRVTSLTPREWSVDWIEARMSDLT